MAVARTKSVVDEAAEQALALAIETARRRFHNADTPWKTAIRILGAVQTALEGDDRWVIDENRKKKKAPVSFVRRASPKVDVLYRRLKNSAIN